jgi:hypothetical protein
MVKTATATTDLSYLLSDQTEKGNLDAIALPTQKYATCSAAASPASTNKL